MRQLLFLPLLMLLLFSCGENKTDSSDNFSSMTFSIDTVVVDAGQEIINLKYGLWRGVFNSDHSTLYLWDDDDVSMAKISINDLTLEEKIKFEKEGPDGVGSFLSWINILENGNFLMANFTDIGLFDQSGKKLRTYDLKKENFLIEDNHGNNLYRQSIMTDEGDIIYGMMGNWSENTTYFVKLDFKEKHLKKLELSGLEALPDYSVILKTADMMSIATSDKALSRCGNRLIFSSSTFNTLYSIDLSTDSVHQINYEPKLTAKSKKGNYPKEVDSEKQFKEVLQDIYKEVNFQAPIWDADNRRFYRFSYETTPSENTDTPLFESSEDMSISKIFLTVFDEHFKVLGESVVPELKKVPNSSFAKDGKIWMYVNVDDELGFARLTIN
jgi:hypothetical protein